MPTDTLRKVWNRSSGVSRMTIYVGVIWLLVALARAVVRFVDPQSQSLSSLVVITSLALIVLLAILALRWLRNVFMWRLRNRLFVTYAFIAVVPVLLLVAMVLIAAWGFAGQFATFIVTSDLRAEIKTADAMNTALAAGIAEQLRAGAPPARALALLDGASRAEVQLAALVDNAGGKTKKARPESVALDALPKHIEDQLQNGDFRALVQEKGRLFIRSVHVEPIGANKLTLVCSLPVERSLLDRITGELGEVTIYPPDLRVRPADNTAGAERQQSKSDSGVVLDEKGVSMRRKGGTVYEQALPSLTAGRLPAPVGRWDTELFFGTALDVVGWDSPDTAQALVSVQTRPSLLYSRLAATLGTPASAVILILAIVAIVFTLIELLALLIGVRLTRTITGAVHNLYEATQHVNRGDLTHRIQVESRDQLAALETSFNSMTGSLEQLIAEQKEKQRIESELAIAQEVQAQLFPRDLGPMETLELFGMCRPARTVSGDYYDFLPLGQEKMGIAVGDISGKGISAALLMATIHSAVRVYEFGRVPSREQLVAAGAAALAAGAGASTAAPAGFASPARVLALLNRHVYHSTPPEKYATLFLGLWDGVTGKLSYSNGGHLPPFVICRDGSVQKLEVGGTVIGLFDAMEYREAVTPLNPGDLFVAYSDGLTEPENEFGEFGEDRLIELLVTHRAEPLPRIAEIVTAAVSDWIGAAEQPDDVTIVLARAR